MLKAILSKKDLTQQTEYYELVKDLLNDRSILDLMNYQHHKCTTRFQHSLNVSYYNYLICRKLHLDVRAGARAGLFHDLFFYDRKEHTPVKGEGWHGVGHPKVAFFNTSELFSIDQREGDMILKHMWPLTLAFPRYRETYVITFVDKFCAVAEVAAHAVNSGKSKLLRRSKAA
ncbi:MAG: HAD family hydrolase [Oscillospiraceae bacterium]